METKDAMEVMELEVFNTLKTTDRLLKMLIHIKQLTKRAPLELGSIKLMELLNLQDANKLS